jgi:hypothetical protein
MGLYLGTLLLATNRRTCIIEIKTRFRRLLQNPRAIKEPITASKIAHLFLLTTKKVLPTLPQRRDIIKERRKKSIYCSDTYRKLHAGKRMREKRRLILLNNSA